LREVLNLYLLKLKTKGIGTDSIGKNKRELTRFVDFANQQGIQQGALIDEVLILRYADTWDESYPSPTTRNLVRHRLVVFLRFCVQLGDLRVVPDVPKPRQKRPPTLPLTSEQYDKLLAAASVGILPARSIPRPVRRAVILLMRWAGPSVTDATTMLRSCIYWDREKQIYRCEYRRKKTGVLVNNPFPSGVAEEILEASKLCSSVTHLFLDAGNEDELSESAHRWTAWFKKTFKKIGIPQGHSHQLRDTFAVGLLLQRVPLESVSRALGHTSIKTTEKYYAPWIKERQDLHDQTLLAAFALGKKPCGTAQAPSRKNISLTS
jgi:integrase